MLARLKTYQPVSFCGGRDILSEQKFCIQEIVFRRGVLRALRDDGPAPLEAGSTNSLAAAAACARS